MAMIDDTKALRAQLLQWAEIESLKRILVSHGSSIEENPRQTLRDLATSLAQYESIIETCRDLDRQPRADALVKLTPKW